MIDSILKKLNPLAVILGFSLLVLTSATDAVSTLVVVGLGVATEANPFMEMILQQSPVGFLAFKVFWPVFLVGILFRFSRESAFLVSLVGASLYGVITLSTLSQLLSEVLKLNP